MLRRDIEGIGGTKRAKSVAVTMILAAVHEALGAVACRYAAQLNNFSASAIRAIGHNELHE